MANEAKPAGMTTKKISRADVRSATLLGLRMVRDDPTSLKITPGQRDSIIEPEK